MTPPLHPVQLYEAAGELLLFFALSLLGRRKRWDGQVLVAYLLGYAVLRFVVELFRGDAARKFVIGALSTSQAIALGRRAPRPRAPAGAPVAFVARLSAAC